MSHLINRRGFLAATASLAALHPFSVNASTNQVHLRIMETTDLSFARSAQRRQTLFFMTMVTSCRATRWAITWPMSAA